MEEDLLRVESAVSATSSGNLTWEQWPFEVATALGLAGRRNPIGFAMVRYLDSPSAFTAQGVVLHLSTWAVGEGFDGSQANDLAWKAFGFWADYRCTRCDGRGNQYIGKREFKCDACGGSGHRTYDDKPDPVRAGIDCLMEAERWMESQLRARMRRGG